MEWLKALLGGGGTTKRDGGGEVRGKQALVDSLDDIVKSRGKGSYKTLRALASQASRDEFINFVHCPSFVGSKVWEGELVDQGLAAARQKTMLFNASMVNLLVEGGSLQESIFLLRKPVGESSSITMKRFSVGRSVGSDLPMIDFTISRSHALVELKQEGYLLSDLESSNGTFVNGVRVSRSGVVLQDGDKVRFARYEFLFLLAGSLYDLLKPQGS